MWTPATRRQHNRDELRYATDLTDAEWKILTRYLPAPATTGRRRTPLREIVPAIFSILRAGCPWRLLPRSFPPWKTVYRWFARFRDDGTWRAINHRLLVRGRERVGREATLRWLSIGFADGTLRELRPGTAVIASQSVQTTEAGGPKGYDAGKKVSGRKRHALVDTDGRPLVLHAHPASVQDRDGAVPLLKASRSSSGRSPIAPTPPAGSPRPHRSLSRSCASHGAKSASPCSPDAGSLRVPSRGSIAIAISPRTSKQLSRLQPRSSMLPPLCRCFDAPVVMHEIRDGLLGKLEGKLVVATCLVEGERNAVRADAIAVPIREGRVLRCWCDKVILLPEV